MATSRRGKINEVFDEEAVIAQIKRVSTNLSEFIDVINKVKPVVSVLQNDSVKTKETIDGMKAIAQATQQITDISNKTNASLAQMTEMTKKATEGYGQLGASLEANIKKQLQYKIRLDEIKKAMKDLEQFKGIGGDGAKKIQDQLAALVKEETELKQASSLVTTAIKGQVKEMQAMPGSIDEARAKLKLLRMERNALDLSTESGQAMKKSLNDQIDLLDEFVRKENDAYTQRKINIGNYEGSAKIIVDALERQREKAAALSKELGATHPAAQAAGRELQALERITENPQFLNIAAKAGDANAELRQMTKTLIDLDRQGLGKTDFANELRKHLAELKDQIEDTRGEIKALSSDSYAFDQLANSVTFLANTYQTVVGAQALFGKQNEEVEETIKKLVAVQSVANGLQQMSKQLTEQGTIVNKAYVAVQKLWTTATDTSAASTVRLAAATKLIAGGLIIGAIVIIVQKLIEWSNATTEAAQKTKNLTEVTSKAADKFAEANVKVNEMKQTLQLAKNGVIDKKKALEEYNTSIGKVIGQAKDLNEAEQTLIDKAPDYIQFTLLKAKAEAAAELAKESLKKSIEESTKSIDDFISTGEQAGTILSDLGENFLSLFGVSSKPTDLNKVGEKNKADAIKTEQDKYAAFSKLQENFYKEAAEFARTHKLNFFEDDGKDKGNGGNDQTEKDLRARFELYKLAKQREINLQKATANDSGNPIAARYNALMDALKKEESLINDQRDFDLSNQKLTENERKLIVAKSEDEILKIRTDAGAKLVQIQTDNNEAQKKILQDLKDFRQSETDKQIDDLTKDFTQKVNAEQRAADFAIEIEIGRYKTGQINKEQFEAKKLEIENEARRKSLLFEIDYYDKLLKISNLAPDKAAEAEKKLSDLRKQLRDLDLKETQENNDKKAESDKAYHEALRDRLKELGNEIKETVFSLLESGIDKRKNEIQDRIDALDEQKQKEIEVVNQSVLNEQDKAAKIAIINARAQAQQESLERKKRHLDEQKARFEKAKAVAEIIQSTAAAIIKTLAEYPGPHGIVLSAVIGAIGAAQLVRTLATPIPKYKDGTEDHEGGFAIVGDGGKKEYVQTPEGDIYETPDKPTLTNLPKHSKVFKDELALMNAMHRRFLTNADRIETKDSNGYYQFQNMTKEITGKLDEVNKSIKNIPQTNIQVQNPLKTWIRKGGSASEFLGRDV